MKRIVLSLAAAATLLVGMLATPSTAEAQRRGWGGYYGGHYRPSYGSYYRPYNGGIYRPNYRPYYYGGYSYPRYYQYGNGYPRYYNGYGYPGNYYSAPGIRIGAGVGPVRIY